MEFLEKNALIFLKKIFEEEKVCPLTIDSLTFLYLYFFLIHYYSERCVAFIDLVNCQFDQKL